MHKTINKCKMKKLLILAVTAVMSVGAAHAQTPVTYQGEVDLGYSIGVGNFATGRLNVHTVQGVAIGDYLSTGLGLGVDYYHELESVFVPLYLNLKGCLPVSGVVSPYVSFDIGYGFGVSEDVSGLSGLYCNPAIGVRVKAFKAQLGYNAQRVSESGIGFTMGAIQIKVGFVF